MNKYSTLLLAFVLASCAGTDYHQTQTISTRSIDCVVRLNSKYHNLWFDLHDENPQDAKITVKAWATNLGHDVILTRYRVYDGSISPSGICVPAYQEPLKISSGERKLFYVGPIEQLAITFMEPPQSSARLRIEVLLDEAPKEPLHGRFASTWGGP
jgi:hypothetical protein